VRTARWRHRRDSRSAAGRGSASSALVLGTTAVRSAWSRQATAGSARWRSVPGPRRSPAPGRANHRAVRDETEQAASRHGAWQLVRRVERATSNGARGHDRYQRVSPTAPRSVEAGEPRGTVLTKLHDDVAVSGADSAGVGGSPPDPAQPAVRQTAATPREAAPAARPDCTAPPSYASVGGTFSSAVAASRQVPQVPATAGQPARRRRPPWRPALSRALPPALSRVMGWWRSFRHRGHAGHRLSGRRRRLPADRLGTGRCERGAGAGA
jgi:hypothetical protein